MRPYVCTKCGATECKLWREYQVFADRTQLLCVHCAIADQKQDGQTVPRLASDVGEDGKHLSIAGRTDSIGWLVPAVPDGDTFWGYSSVPPERVAWWRALPTLPTTKARP